MSELYKLHIIIDCEKMIMMQILMIFVGGQPLTKGAWSSFLRSSFLMCPVS